MGVIIIYTGNGKGKTSACIGQAIRALGNGMTVVFAQFIKRDGVAGEQKILKKLLGNNFRPGGLGFVTNPKDTVLHRQKAQELFTWAQQTAAKMIVLDEALYACTYGLLDWHQLELFADRRGSRDRHLVLSGRSPENILAKPDVFFSNADIVTVLQPERHLYVEGYPACAGVEF